MDNRPVILFAGLPLSGRSTALRLFSELLKERDIEYSTFDFMLREKYAMYQAIDVQGSNMNRTSFLLNYLPGTQHTYHDLLLNLHLACRETTKQETDYHISVKHRNKILLSSDCWLESDLSLVFNSGRPVSIVELNRKSSCKEFAHSKDFAKSLQMCRQTANLNPESCRLTYLLNDGSLLDLKENLKTYKEFLLCQQP